jgi:hypothetical protein
MAAALHFRNCSWGMTRGQVEAKEDAPLAARSPLDLIFQGTLLGFRCTIFYQFVSDALWRGAYKINNPDDVADIHAYDKLVVMLSGKYGTPITKEPVWTNPAERHQIESLEGLAEAVATGGVTLKAAWSTPDTNVGLVCIKDPSSYDAIVWLLYTSIKI